MGYCPHTFHKVEIKEFFSATLAAVHLYVLSKWRSKSATSCAPIKLHSQHRLSYTWCSSLPSTTFNSFNLHVLFLRYPSCCPLALVSLSFTRCMDTTDRFIASVVTANGTRIFYHVRVSFGYPKRKGSSASSCDLVSWHLSDWLTGPLLNQIHPSATFS